MVELRTYDSERSINIQSLLAQALTVLFLLLV